MANEEPTVFAPIEYETPCSTVEYQFHEPIDLEDGTLKSICEITEFPEQEELTGRQVKRNRKKELQWNAYVKRCKKLKITPNPEYKQEPMTIELSNAIQEKKVRNVVFNSIQGRDFINDIRSEMGWGRYDQFISTKMSKDKEIYVLAELIAYDITEKQKETGEVARPNARWIIPVDEDGNPSAPKSVVWKLIRDFKGGIVGSYQLLQGILSGEIEVVDEGNVQRVPSAKRLSVESTKRWWKHGKHSQNPNKTKNKAKEPLNKVA